MENNLATELLKELKAGAKRWFIIAMVELVIIVSMVIGIFWYISLPVEEGTDTEQTMEDIESSDITQVGGDYDGNGKTEKDYIQETGGTE